MKKIDFVLTFRRLATQNNVYALAGNWARLAAALAETGRELTPAEAAAWADLGYWAGEARQMILDGITAAQQAEIEAHAAEQVGGPEALGSCGATASRLPGARCRTSTG